ncbi:hypothetical protein [Streptomyces microflavus]|uniref:Uncharacterized protein n=1 Tax=Streptomyces microflavus TaxID=1919 RepID=A0A7H8N0A6_STRMI|nr:hypothetical protein [Streptomyces microflavus]QKW47917.1 hypothetical protein HUT09_35990 [Streptomyces microflavus]
MNKETAPRRFGPDFVAEQLRRYGKRPPENRMLSYDLAVLEEYEPWRIWLDEQLDLLPDATAAVFAANLWRDQNFWPDIIELAAGAALRRKGLTVEFERRWANLTPDWTVLDEAGAPVALVEVLTHSPQQGTSARMKAWHALVERLKQIPVPVVLTVAGDASGPLGAPDARTAKKIAQDLRGALLSPLHRSEFRSQGYTFLLQADPRTRQPMRPPGKGTILMPPSNLAGVISAQPVAAGIQKKISKYRALAEEAGVPLIVAVGADKFTGLEVQHFDDLLRGAPTLSVQFNFGDSFIHKPVDIDPFNPPRWTMPPDLAGVLWVNNQFPFISTWRTNPGATTPAPPGLTGQEPSPAM